MYLSVDGELWNSERINNFIHVIKIYDFSVIRLSYESFYKGAGGIPFWQTMKIDFIVFLKEKNDI